MLPSVLCKLSYDFCWLLRYSLCKKKWNRMLYCMLLPFLLLSFCFLGMNILLDFEVDSRKIYSFFTGLDKTNIYIAKAGTHPFEGGNIIIWVRTNTVESWKLQGCISYCLLNFTICNCLYTIQPITVRGYPAFAVFP